MIMRESELFSTILDVAQKENKILMEQHGKGIFFMPELAFAYLCGKSIMKNQTEIFGKADYRWVREKEYKNYGIADLVFEALDDSSPEVVIEFKMDDTSHKYLRDIKKLRSLKGNFKKYFCSLKWVFTDQVEDFLSKLKKKFDSKLIGHKTIGTSVGSSKRGDQCLLILWEVNGS